LPVSTVVPVPCWITLPVPEMVPANVDASLRLSTSDPLSVTSPMMLPVLPPSPSCSAPASIVVPPV